MNIEIKAKSDNQDMIREILKSKNADFRWTDHQIDTYFNVNFGRLKLREGNIENHLIQYQREDKEGPKQSDVTLFKSDPKSSLKEILKKALGILVVVDKKREIYFLDNVKIHIDYVKGIGNFIEIEAIDKDKKRNLKELKEQCNYYVRLFEIEKKDMIDKSYSDIILEKKALQSHQ